MENKVAKKPAVKLSKTSKLARSRSAKKAAATRKYNKTGKRT